MRPLVSRQDKRGANRSSVASNLVPSRRGRSTKVCTAVRCLPSSLPGGHSVQPAWASFSFRELYPRPRSGQPAQRGRVCSAAAFAVVIVFTLAPALWVRSYNGQAGSLQHGRRRGHRRRSRGPHHVPILLFSPPVSSPLPLLPVLMRRAFRESLATGSGAKFRAQFLACGAPCCRQSLTFSLPTRPAAPPVRRAIPQPTQPTRGKTASSWQTRANGSASTKACRRHRATSRTKMRARRALLIVQSALLVVQSLPQCAAATADPYAQKCQNMCPLLNTNKLKKNVPFIEYK